MLQQVRDYITALPDDELVAYVKAGTSMYDPEAVEFAQTVLKVRWIDDARLAQLSADADQRQATQATEDQARATAQLALWQRVLAFIAGMFMVGLGLPLLFIVWTHFRSSGQREKAAQLWRCAWWGLGSLFGAALLLVVLVRL